MTAEVDIRAARRPTWRMLGAEWRTVGEGVQAFIGRDEYRSWPKGDGHPVLVIPGFLAGPASTRYLRGLLRYLGYRTYDWGLGVNLGVREGLQETLEHRLVDLAVKRGRSVSVIGWSAGGIYAREIARAHPEVVRQVITMGSPIRGDHEQTRAWRLYRRMNSGVLTDELMSEASRAARAEPLTVPTTCIYSRSDGIVAWQLCTSEPAPQTENVEVHSSHLGYGHQRETLWVVADRLAQPEGEWAPFVPPERTRR